MPSRDAQNGGGGTSTGGRASGSGGSGGNTGSGGATGSGGSMASGGTSGTGGSSSGAGGGNGGSGGSMGTGGSSQPADAAVDQRAGTGGGSAGAGGDSGGGSGTARGGSAGSTTQTGGATGGATMGTGGRTGGSPGTGGRTGTGGAPGTGGAIGTGGSTAPTACSFPSAWNPGNATYTTYTLPNASTACGYEGSNNTIKNIVSGGNFAAIPGNTSSDFNTSNRCGACVQIGGAIITIVDECPNDSNAPCKANPTGHLDLSQAGASAGGVQGDPAKQGQAQWKFVPCPINGNVMVRLKNGNNNEMFIENEILPIQAVTCGGQTGSRTSYGAWHFGSNMPGASCDLTDIAGRKITVTAGSTQGQNLDTGKQFPKCQ